jgi:hypothetical protein
VARWLLWHLAFYILLLIIFYFGILLHDIYVWFILSYVLFLSFPYLNIKIEMPVNIRSSLLDRMINHKPSCKVFLFLEKETRCHDITTILLRWTNVLNKVIVTVAVALKFLWFWLLQMLCYRLQSLQCKLIIMLHKSY